ncbi:MAG: hypothetical protein ABIB93_02205 [Chloroflexota bacterium]
MMDILSNDELKALMGERNDFCISIYMPTERVGDIQQNRIRLKNLLGRAEDQLITSGTRSAEARKILEPVRSFETGTLFWQNRSNGLAIFISPNTFRYGHLPLHFEEKMVVNNRFLIKPLLPILSGNSYFFILSVSQNNLSLFKCTRYSTSEVDLEGIVPRSRDEALRFDDYEKQFQHHAGSARVAGAGNAIVFQGRAIGDIAKNNILRYFQQIDRGLSKILNEEKAPLIFAGVDYLLPIYQEANTYQNLMSERIMGNPEEASPEKLRDLAWNIIEPYLQKRQSEAIIRYGEIAGKGVTSTNMMEIALAAYDGRIGTLFLTPDLEEWGTFDPESRSVILHERPEPYDQDLTDFVAVHTLTNKGIIYNLAPDRRIDGSPVAAVFRY